MYRTLRISRAATIDCIKGMHGSKDNSSLRLVFQDGTYVTITSEHEKKTLSALADLFGATSSNQDLQEKIRGQRLVYCMTEHQVLCGFTPYSQWEGQEMVDGDFLVDTDSACCGGLGAYTPEIIPHDQLDLFEEKHTPTYEFSIEPGGNLPKRPPKSALLLCGVEWAWSPIHDRMEYYYISRTRDRKHWILWRKYFNEYYKWSYRIYCLASAVFKSHYEAGKEMLKQAWSWEKKEMMMGCYHDIISDGALTMNEIEEIAEEVWPSFIDG